MSAEIAQLEATIAALSAQRAVLGDLVVDTALAPLRARLASLQAPAEPPPAPVAPVAPPAAAEQSLRQVTILFLDVVGSTALSQQLDPEDIHAVMDDALSRCTTLVVAHGGRVLQYAGDNLLAVWGAGEIHEDDAERAVLCGLALLAEGLVLGEAVAARHGHQGFNVRVGVHTGAVLLGGGVDAEGSIRGQPVNIAARMEQTAPPGALRISQDTYRQVRGVFDVVDQPPIAVKGIAEPMTTYLVQRLRPRAFNAGTRGIEGLATPMIGRDAELAQLQQALAQVRAERRLELVTVVAEAGLGKSRLLQAFGRWADDQGQPLYILQGRAHPQTQGQAFGLLRDVLAWRLQITDADSTADARRKIEQGLVPLFVADQGPELAQAQAHLLGHLIGLDFGDSPHLRGILDDPQQVRTRGFHAAAQAMRRISAADGTPIVLQLDDLHWADEGSLAFIRHLLRANHDVPMLVLALTRPTLFERHAEWPGLAVPGRQLALSPLDRNASAQLAAELLRRLPEVPEMLAALIVDRAEGNPFYMEELVKMLIDQGALQTDGPQWVLHPDRLLRSALPATLTGVLQARLDGLPGDERQALQHGSVIGQVFWDQALAALDAQSPLALPGLVQRRLALPRPDTVLDGASEYAFSHQFLHEVTYGTLLKKARRLLHGRAAAWLSARSGPRAADFLGAAAEHFEQAGDLPQACDHHGRAAERARQRFAHEAALDHVQRALALLPQLPPETPDLAALHWRLLDVRERTFELQGRRPEQRADLDALQALADASGDAQRRAVVAVRRAVLGLRTGDHALVQAQALQARALAAQAGDDALRLNAVRLLADALTRQGDPVAGQALARDGLAEARRLGLQDIESRFLNVLGVIAARGNDLVAMLQYSQQATELRRALGDRRNEAIGLATLGSSWLELGQLDRARTALDRALLLQRAVGDRGLEPLTLANLSQLALWQDDTTSACQQAEAALALARQVQASELEAIAAWCLGHAQLQAGQRDEARRAFELALRIAEAGDSPIRFDAMAGLGRVAWLSGDMAGGLQVLQPVLADGAADAALAGTLALRLVQWTAYEVLHTAGDARARPLLQAAHQGLTDYAQALSDAALRASFLAEVPVNAAIVRAWASSAV